MPKKELKEVDVIQRKILKAQEAVSKMTDENLKTVAFQTVLQRLLTIPDLETGSETQVDGLSATQGKPESKKRVSAKGPKGRIEELIIENFFAQKRTLNDIKHELENHGWFHRVQILNPAVLRLVHERKLRRIKEPETKGGKLIWRYSNW